MEVPEHWNDGQTHREDLKTGDHRSATTVTETAATDNLLLLLQDNLGKPSLARRNGLTDVT